MFSLLLAIIYLSFISLGLPDSLLGSAWPTMYPQLGVPVSYSGIVFMIISVGTIISSLQSDRLTRRLDEGEVTELILALGATLEAENTASFIRQMVRKRFPQIRVSRLAQGIPLGAEVKYMDKETLRQSLQYRQDL